MNRTLIYPAVIILLLAGCRQKENVSQLKEVNQSLEFSNNILESDTRMIYEDLSGKLKDPQTHEQASRWRPKAMHVKQYADSIKGVIESIKGNIIEKTDSLKARGAAMVKQLCSTSGDGYKLLNMLATFKDSIPAFLYDSEFIKNPRWVEWTNRDITRLKESIPLLKGYVDSITDNQRSLFIKKWLEENLAGGSALTAVVMLNKIKSDVLATEKMLIDYCKNHIGELDGYGLYSVFHAIAFLSSSYVKPGQPIEVTAGVGQLSDAAKPRITINGKEIKTGDDGAATYSFIASGKPGEHSIPVKIEHYKPDGSIVVINKELKYIIAEEK